jgi:hypothetical protein
LPFQVFGFTAVSYLRKSAELADENLALLRTNPRHHSLRFKKVGVYWTARVGLHYRALAKERDDWLVWFWIGAHDQYEGLITT